MQRIFLIHGWGGSPDNDWFPWANKALTEKGYEVVVPEMPETEHPKIGPWVNKLSDVVGEIRESDIFVGHSIGCQTILRFLEGVTNGEKTNKLIFVAPWWFLNLENLDADEKIARPWIDSIIDFEKVRLRIGDMICIFSDNDPFVPLEKNRDFFEDKFKPQTVVVKSAGHFIEDDGMTKLEMLLDFFDK